MKFRWLGGLAALAGLALSPVGAVAASSAAAPQGPGSFKVKIEGTTKPKFVPNAVTVVGSTTCTPSQVVIKNKTTMGVSLTPGDGYVILPGHSIHACYNPGAQGTYKVVVGLEGYKSTLTVTVLP